MHLTLQNTSATNSRSRIWQRAVRPANSSIPTTGTSTHASPDVADLATILRIRHRTKPKSDAYIRNTIAAAIRK